ncbi:TetR/AcrR family transcriptional regulator [Streptosporangium carneum]|uniref:TetR family transcriptional regulator n=1 Tax=Streptosporangium carneum TaxID=47481 RepID=A0A9W6I1L5_9ACTN|nr:TetR/AcrR family transcriptional regulator [Streptosporangium carneum]GLK09584.1 TetR family transcriptional regulator [Streptosporangium carneum]
MTKASSRKELMSNTVLEKAAVLFAERGFAGTSLRDIAEAMGMTRPALYYYFDSKETLLRELVRGITGVGSQELRKLRERTDLSAAEKLRTVVIGTAVRVAESPVRFRLLERNEAELPDSILQEHSASKGRILDELSAIIGDGVRSGEFRPVNERITAFSVIGMINWIAWWYNPQGPSSPEEIAEEMYTLVSRGLLRGEDRVPARGIEGAVALLREDLTHLERLLADGERPTS